MWPNILQLISFNTVHPYQVDSMPQAFFHRFIIGFFDRTRLLHLSMVRKKVQLKLRSPFTCWVSVKCVVSVSTLTFIGSSCLKDAIIPEPACFGRTIIVFSSTKVHEILSSTWPYLCYRCLVGQGSMVYAGPISPGPTIMPAPLGGV